jgi:predicted ATPase
MIIEKLRVKNYKSLEAVEVPLRPLTVFVGTNNSGKSNIEDSRRKSGKAYEVLAKKIVGRQGTPLKSLPRGELLNVAKLKVHLSKTSGSPWRLI